MYIKIGDVKTFQNSPWMRIACYYSIKIFSEKIVILRNFIFEQIHMGVP